MNLPPLRAAGLWPHSDSVSSPGPVDPTSTGTAAHTFAFAGANASVEVDTHVMYPHDPYTPWYAIFFLVASNLAFIPVIWRSLQFRQYIRAVIFTGNLLSSSTYHLCKPVNGVCLLPYYALGNFDFFFAILNPVVVALYLIPFDAIYKDPVTGKYVGRGVKGAVLVRHSLRHIEQMMLLGYGFLIAILLALGFNSFVAFGVVGGSVSVIVLAAVLYNYSVYEIRPHFDWPDLVIALVLLATGSTLFIVQEFMSPQLYWIVHSIWHVLAAVGQLYLLDSRNWQHRALLDLRQTDLEDIEQAELVDPVYSQPAYNVSLILSRLNNWSAWSRYQHIQ